MKRYHLSLMLLALSAIVAGCSTSAHRASLSLPKLPLIPLPIPVKWGEPRVFALADGQFEQLATINHDAFFPRSSLRVLVAPEAVSSGLLNAYPARPSSPESPQLSPNGKASVRRRVVLRDGEHWDCLELSVVASTKNLWAIGTINSLVWSNESTQIAYSEIRPDRMPASYRYLVGSDEMEEIDTRSPEALRFLSEGGISRPFPAAERIVRFVSPSHVIVWVRSIPREDALLEWGYELLIDTANPIRNGVLMRAYISERN